MPDAVATGALGRVELGTELQVGLPGELSGTPRTTVTESEDDGSDPAGDDECHWQGGEHATSCEAACAAHRMTQIVTKTPTQTTSTRCQNSEMPSAHGLISSSDGERTERTNKRASAARPAVTWAEWSPVRPQ